MLERETILKHGCQVVLCRIVGREATEIFMLCEPLPAEQFGAFAQSEAVYRATASVLSSAGGSFASVVSETLFIRRIQADLEAIRSARCDVLAGSASEYEAHANDAAFDFAATLEIEQPPLAVGVRLQVAFQAIIPSEGAGAGALEKERCAIQSACACSDCASVEGVRFRAGASGESRFYAAGICGAGADAYAQTRSMFEAAENLLRCAGMDFGDVVRAWIHLREIDRDYDAFNSARRAFFESRGVRPVPASTGIGGSPAASAHDLCLGVYAVKAPHSTSPVVMTSPTLNEAGSYGADFVRGMRGVESNKVALHISGTASIDEAGRTAHVGDFNAQADRMLLNVEALLLGQGAGFEDVVSAVTYVKHAEDAPRLRAKFASAGYTNFPNAFVHAPVCRPELLCETEALAVLPKDIHT